MAGIHDQQNENHLLFPANGFLKNNDCIDHGRSFKSSSLSMAPWLQRSFFDTVIRPADHGCFANFSTNSRLPSASTLMVIQRFSSSSLM